MADVVVVGAGLAGARTCALLRDAGFDGTLTLLGAETDPPYDRPPLTKDPEADTDLRTAMGLDVWAHADQVRLGVPAQSLRGGPSAPAGAEPWRVACADGSEVAARAVVLATGAEPRIPAGWAGPGVHLLRTRAQALAIWAAVRPGTRVVIVGGGWIGCEAAATAAARGAHVVLCESGPHLLPGQVPEAVAAEVQQWLVEAGVEVCVDLAVAGIGTEGQHLRVAGRTAELVLVALGVRPATEWLADTGLRQDASGAVLVDEVGRSNTAGVFAVGDCAARWSPRRAQHLPGGHWTEAMNAPEQLAPAVVRWLSSGQLPDEWAGARGNGPSPDPIPYVFSDIAGRRLLSLGAPGTTGAPETGRAVWRRAGSGWTCYSVDEQLRLVGLCTQGRPRDLVAARRAMLADPAGQPRVDLDALADPDAGPTLMFPRESPDG